MTNFIDGAVQILEEHSREKVAPGFTERLEVAAREGDDGPDNRRIAAPYYLTDLGVRRFNDLAIYLLATCHSPVRSRLCAGSPVANIFPLCQFSSCAN